MDDLDMLKGIQYLIDQEGKPEAIQMRISDWNALLDYLETLEDRALVRSILPQLGRGPEKSNAVFWEKASPEWESDL